MTTIIIVGSNHANTAKYHNTLGLPASVLVTEIDHGQLIGHTCIQDVPDFGVLETILKNANEVYWAESSEDEFYDADSYYDFLYWLQLYNLKYKNVKNFQTIVFDPYKWNFDLPELTDNDMVFLGGSVTAGVGLSSMDTCYTNKMAKYFEKNPVNLALMFTNTRFSGIGNNDKTFDIFTSLKFVPNQLVVILLTPFDRIRYCDENKQLTDIQLSQYTGKNLIELIEIFNRPYIFYKTLLQIKAMLQIARSKGIRLVICLDDYKIDQERQIEQLYFYNFKEVVPKTLLQNYLVDFGNDNVHPGVTSHDILATTMIKYIENIYEK
jgi:hypothetical protein